MYYINSIYTACQNVGPEFDRGLGEKKEVQLDLNGKCRPNILVGIF